MFEYSKQFTSTVFLMVLLSLLLSSCPESSDPNKPVAAITSPASDATLSATVPIQVDATDDTGVSRIDVYARGRGSKSDGVNLGSAVSRPYVISWDTTGVPNNTELELVARAFDAAGNAGDSTPVRVKTQNANVPSLTGVFAYSLPPKPPEFASSGVRTQSVGGDFLPAHTRALLTHLEPPIAMGLEAARLQAQRVTVRPQALTRDLALEWEWSPFQSVGSVSGADGYGLMLSTTDIAGPYARQINQSAAASGAQKFSRLYPDATLGGVYYGCVTAIVENRTRETPCSNADAAKFPPVQDVAAPADGATLGDGRPTLTWTATPGAVGYLYLVYDRNPWDANAKIVYRNTPASQTTDKLLVAYPPSSAALPSGTYFWWVAGVSFDTFGKADGFSFSDPRRFVVP
jgi:Bacterial Ig domain